MHIPTFEPPSNLARNHHLCRGHFSELLEDLPGALDLGDGEWKMDKMAEFLGFWVKNVENSGDVMGIWGYHNLSYLSLSWWDTEFPWISGLGLDNSLNDPTVDSPVMVDSPMGKA